jgi:hypothetical protein|tara:strand:- start:557 stop:784 length:228 start_codon:yes stop_codon:yes gene_type:complete
MGKEHYVGDNVRIQNSNGFIEGVLTGIHEGYKPEEEKSLEIDGKKYLISQFEDVWLRQANDDLAVWVMDGARFKN